MEINNSFSVPVPIADAWSALTNIEEIVPCMPGAELVEVGDDGTYKGKVTTRLGPVTMTFGGTANFTEMDEAEHRAVIKAKGSDTKGRGNVDADITLTLKVGDGATTDVSVHTDLTLSGSVAQYGRGSGMVTDLANHWMGQFSECLGQRLPAARDASQGGESSAEIESAQPSAVNADPSGTEPMQVGGLGLKLLWRALLRAVGVIKNT